MLEVEVPASGDTGGGAGGQALRADSPALDKIFGQDESETEEFARIFGADGDEKSADKPDSQPEAKAEEADEEENAAWAALERDGWKKADLKRLSRERLMELGGKRAKVHADVDQAYSDLKALKAKLAASEQGAKAGNTDALDSAASADLSAGLEALAALEDPEMGRLLKGAVQPLIAELQRLRGLADQYVARDGERERGRLRESFVKAGYDKLKDDVAWEAALAAGRQLLPEHDGNPEAAMKAALTRVYGEVKEKPKAGPIKNVATIPERRDGPVAKTKEQKAFLVLSALDRGASRADAAKLME